ncbi:uncharacterized protein LOC128679827 [Plodia interpunctella]|uniref:uncharacterized protein LOC128679827 n=1 Tax=Plodia interpunctella TaxID=58824 RepID=UPI0031013E72
MVYNNLRSRHSEVLLSNFIDEDFQNMLYPLNLMQILFFNQKFRIKNNFITSNNFLQNVVIVFGFIFYTFVFMTRFFLRYNKGVDIDFNLISLICNIVGFSMNCIMTILHTNINIDLVLIIYKINTHQRGKIDLRNITFWNWVLCFIIIFSFIIVISLIFFLNPIYTYVSILMFIITTIFAELSSSLHNP